MIFSPRLSIRGIRLSTLTALVALLLCSTAYAQNTPNYFEPLKQKLLKDANPGLSAEYIRDVFQNPGLVFETKGISSYFRHQESKLNYDQFLSDKSLSNARAYMKERQCELTRAESKFGVDKEVITAVMLVETRLGTYTGYQDVINILATMAALSDKEVRETFWDQLPEEGRISRERFEKKADAKSDWAYRELKAFLTYTSREAMDPFEIKGSYAGALGIAQFMPSNILLLGEDGNGDGRVNLLDHEDAIFSIAGYLRHYGWQPGIGKKKAHRVIMHYNHSKYYADIVLKISDRLKG